VAAVIGALIATPALADATVSPTTAVQGSGENLTFHVTNNGNLPLGTVTVKLPADTSVAEVYPLSVDDWAPKIQMRKVAEPLTTVHGTKTDEVTDSITWLAVGGHQLAPGASADLPIAIGPLPTLSTMQFTITTTYANGAAGPLMPPVPLTLTPGDPGAAVTGHDHGGTADGTTGDTTGTDEENAVFANAVADATRGPSIWAIGGWVIAALALLAAAFYFVRGRHRAGDEDDEPEDEPESATVATEDTDEKQPVTAGKWSIR